MMWRLTRKSYAILAKASAVPTNRPLAATLARLLLAALDLHQQPLVMVVQLALVRQALARPPVAVAAALVAAVGHLLLLLLVLAVAAEARTLPIRLGRATVGILLHPATTTLHTLRLLDHLAFALGDRRGGCRYIRCCLLQGFPESGLSQMWQDATKI